LGWRVKGKLAQVKNMEYLDAIHKFYENYHSSIDFKKWQDKLSKEIYSSLHSNSKDDSGEIKTVGRLCEAMSNQKYKGLCIESKKIHSRSTSGVEFDYINKKSTRELADMVIVSVVTFKKEIMLLKTAFIQNKKAKGEYLSWSCEIEPEQLFLLKNFPTFTGVKGSIFGNGIFKGKEITLLNHSGSLGNYGLFTPSGDMVFLTSRNVFCNQSLKDTITFSDIKKAASLNMPFGNTVHGFEYFRKCGIYFANKDYVAFPIGRHNLPFFNNYNYALDVHEIVKQLTYFNIGEPISEFKHKTDHLCNYTKNLLHFFGYKIDDNRLSRNPEGGDIPEESEIHVILNHLELGET